jgi:hypothetical protein
MAGADALQGRERPRCAGSIGLNAIEDFAINGCPLAAHIGARMNPCELSDRETLGYLIAALSYFVNHAPDRVLILDRSELHYSQKLFVEVYEDGRTLAFSFMGTAQ